MYSIHTRILINNTNISDVCKQIKESRLQAGDNYADKVCT